MRPTRKPQPATARRPADAATTGRMSPARDSHLAHSRSSHEYPVAQDPFIRALPAGLASRASASEAAEERQELSLLVGRERREAIAWRPPLAVVCEDRVLDRGRAAVVQGGGDGPEAPQWRGTHLDAGRLSLRDAVPKAAHVVQQEIRIGLERPESERLDVALAGPERPHVAARAPHALEQAAAGGRALPACGARGAYSVGWCRRWREEPHEVPEELDVLEV